MIPVLTALLLVLALPASAGVLTVEGGAAWTGTLTMTWQAEALHRVTRLDLRLPLPVPRQGWGWRLTLGAPAVRLTPQPAWQRQGADALEVQWHHQRPQAGVEVRVPVQMAVQVQPLNASAAYPLESVSPEAQPFLQPSPWADPGAVASQVRSVVAGAGSAVQALVDVAAWLRGRFGYRPAQEVEDAGAVLRQGAGDLPGLVHLWLAALRAVGLPARAVLGVDAGVDLAVDGEGEPRRIPGLAGFVPWLEVWLPEHGWVAVDPRGLVGWLPPGRVPLVVAADVPAALETATVRWRHVAGVAVAPRFAWEAQVSAPSLARLAARATSPGPLVLLPAPPQGRKPLRPRTEPPGRAPDLCLPAVAVTSPGRYGAGQAIHAEAMEARPRLAVRLHRALTDRTSALAQPVRVEAGATFAAVELALWRERGSGQLWVELWTDANATSPVGAPGERLAVSRPVPAQDLPGRPGWVRFSLPHPHVPAGRYWVVPQFSGSLQARWLLDPVPLGEGLGISSLLAPGRAAPLEARGLMRLCP